MKKVTGIALFVVCVLFACLSMTACKSISKEDYDKLSNEYKTLSEEKRELERIADWLELYNSIEIGQSFSEIRAMFDFEYSSYSGGTYTSSDDSETHVMRAYTWENKYVFDMYHREENQIVVVFLDDVSIYKQYGNQQLVLDCGTVCFPAPKV